MAHRAPLMAAAHNACSHRHRAWLDPNALAG